MLLKRGLSSTNSHDTEFLAMRVSCVLSADQLGPQPADLILLPEGVGYSEIETASSTYPDAMVIGAVLEKNCGENCFGGECPSVAASCTTMERIKSAT